MLVDPRLTLGIPWRPMPGPGLARCCGVSFANAAEHVRHRRGGPRRQLNQDSGDDSGDIVPMDIYGYSGDNGYIMIYNGPMMDNGYIYIWIFLSWSQRKICMGMALSKWSTGLRFFARCLGPTSCPWINCTKFSMGFSQLHYPLVMSK